MLMMFELGSSTSLLKWKIFRNVIGITTEFDDFSCIGFSTTYLFKLCLRFIHFTTNETKYL